ncbi:MAG: type fatty acid synthase ArsA [Gemmataceae bacterium]|nr:type fatty acid synthase ArsA [Gemmataceae bacterium]
MLSPFLIVTPGHCVDARLAIAAVRAGETGVLDLGYRDDQPACRAALRDLARYAPAGSPWGLRWDTLGDPARGPSGLHDLVGDVTCPVMILAGLGEEARAGAAALREPLGQARRVAGRVVLEVCGTAEALAAQEAGFDGLVVKGHEAGGRVGEESAFLLLQRLHGRLAVPYWVQGGIGPDTAAAAFLAGAAGVVLGEQLWLAAESPLDEGERRQWGLLDGSETVCVGAGALRFRFFSRSGPQAVRELGAALAGGAEWPAWLRQRLGGGARPGAELRVPLGQEIAFAKGLAEQHVTVAGTLAAFRQRVRADLDTARRARAFAPDAPLARANGTRYPILQGPMTRVSDTAAFAAAVADNGALPFLALALMTGPEVNKLLTETARELGPRSWGVGVLGFVPADLRKAQLAEVCKVRPTHAIIAGGRPSLARQLEDHGIATYLHVPSPGLLESFLRDGARKFVFEGRECGGHVGPRTSFSLWQSAVDVLLRADLDRPEDVHVVFAGGIHDRLSAAMVAATAAPLAGRGMKTGVLMGTAYLFTREAVETGAILPGFQRQALACQETILLESGIGHATRCAPTPFAAEFTQARAELIRAGKDTEEIRQELEVLNVGRLRIAAKGLTRPSDPRRPAAKADLAAVPEDVQHREGLYMIGQVAGLRDEVVSMAALHAEVADGNLAVLEAEAPKPLPWHPAAAPPGAKPAEVAIVGMACLFPRAGDLRRYWQNICARVDAVREVPSDRWRVEDFFSGDRTARDRVYSKWGAFLEPVLFDPLKWRIPPASLRHIEPMQLLSLEVASRAMADAGYDRRAFPRERAGVLFAVPSSHEFGSAYSFRTMMRHYLPKVEGLPPDVREHIYARLEEHLPEWTEDSFPGFLGNVVAGRIARELDFNGPNFTVDAACAAALAAVFTAVEQLRSGTADLMLVGGADGTNNPFGYMSFAKTQALSPRGRSRPFDDTADGIALGEGIGCVVLKRLADAERDGDKIYAVVKGVGASSDGKNRSLTAPYPPGQARAVNRAYEDARVSPATVSLIEAHGTGTAVGDAAELTTLTQVFSAHTQDRRGVAVGSVKSMIGHTKTLAGLAGVIKTALALKHRVLPATIGVEKPSTRVDFAESPLYLNTETRPWVAEAGDHPRRAGVSSFGFGGTNFHVVLEEYTGNYLPDTDLDWMPRAAEVVVLCRATGADLVRDLRALHQKLAPAATEDLAGLAAAVFAEEGTRPAGARECRLAIVAESVEDLRRKVEKAGTLLTGQAKVNDPAGIYYSEAAPLREDEVCFLYPGQGSQAVNMLRDLVVGSRWSHDLFSAANRLLAETLPRPLSRYVYPPPVFGDADRAGLEAELKDTRVAQPALGLVEVFATDLLARYGIRPARAAGHSYGEHVALYAAGCLSREDLLRLSAVRGQACAEAARSSPGGMAAVAAGAEATAAALKELAIPAHLANLNAPDQTVIAGTVEAIEAAVAQLPGRGLRARRIPVGAAFHTPLLGGAAGAMRQHLAGISVEKPGLPVYSNTTGGPHAEDPDAIRGLLARHFTEPVLFEAQVRRMYADGARLFLEVGPGKVLTDLVSRILPGQPATALSLDAPGREGWTQLGHVLARLSVLGLPVRLGTWFQGRGLPTGTVAEFLAREQAARTPRPTDWLLSPNSAEPVTPLPGRQPERNGTADRAATPKADPPPVAPAAPPPAAAPPQPISVNGSHSRTNLHRTPNREHPALAMSTTNSDLAVNGHAVNGHAVNGHAHAVLPSSNDLFGEVQATTRAFLEAQRAQNGVLERYLETQERLLMYCTQGAPGGAAAPPAPPPVSRMRLAPTGTRPPIAIPATAAAAPTRLTAPAPVPHARATVTPPRTTNGTAAHGNHTAAPPALAPAPPTTPGGGGPPSVDQFRQDLLEVVSRRTGYPIDALDETLALEAALGIDSIKTVEVFSNLKAYHEYFRAEGQEEEELLAEFSKFKTLRDIVQYYDRRRQAHGAAPAGKGAGPSGIENGNGHEAAGGAVKRYTVAAVPAPLEADGAKKNSLTVTSSS